MANNLSVKFSRLSAVAAAAACALLLGGCQSAPKAAAPAKQEPAPAAAAETPVPVTGDRFSDGTYGFMLSSVPSIKGARPLKSLSTREAFENKGVYYFNDTEESSFRITGKDAQNHYAVQESFTKGKLHGFAMNTNLTPVVRNGEAVSIENPSYITEESDGSVKVTGVTGSTPLSLRLKLWAFDVSGLPVYKFLRTRTNYPTDTARYTTAVFPKGSIAYMPQVFASEDTFIVLHPNSFTGSGSVEGFVRNFSKDIPYCLSYLSREGYQAYGVSFDSSALSAGSATTYKTVKQTTWVKNKRGKKVKKVITKKVPVTSQSSVPASGPVSLMHVKTGTVFCQRTTDTPAAKGTYKIVTLNGTRGLSMAFPATVRAPDTGIFELSRNAVSPALVEMKKGNTVSVVPGYHVHANIPVTDFQYRFNDTAAAAVRKAIAEAAPAVKAAKR